MTLLPLINPDQNKEWIENIGKYMINMGGIESISRSIIENLHGNRDVPIYRDFLDARISYLRTRYPNSNIDKYNKAMKMFEVLSKHIGFRNIVAHSGIMYLGKNETSIIGGLLNFQPTDKNNVAEFISIEEIKGRVDESGKLGLQLLELQDDFTLEKTKFSRE